MRIAKLFKPLLICTLVLPLFFTSLTVKAADTVETLMQVDREFSTYAVKNGIKEAFQMFLAEDAVTLDNGEAPKIGYKAIMNSFVAPGNATVFWEPEGGDISGDLGYTWGLFTFTYTADDGSKTYEYGKYLTVWKRQADGSWMVALDIGNNNPKPK